jgi:hypothetical protein
MATTETEQASNILGRTAALEASPVLIGKGSIGDVSLSKEMWFM